MYDWLLIVSIVIGALLLLVCCPIAIYIDIILNISQNYVKINFRLFKVVCLTRLKIYVNNHLSLVMIKNKKTKITPLGQIKMSKPKHLYLLNAVRVKQITSNLTINMFELSSKNSLAQYCILPALYTANGIFIDNGIRSIIDYMIAESDTVLDTQMKITFNILSILLCVIKGVTNGTANFRTKSNSTNS